MVFCKIFTAFFLHRKLTLLANDYRSKTDCIVSNLLYIPTLFLDVCKEGVYRWTSDKNVSSATAGATEFWTTAIFDLNEPAKLRVF